MAKRIVRLLPVVAILVMLLQPTIPVSAADSLEVLSLRTETGKTYNLGGGQRSLVVSAGAVHYKDDYSDPSEQWKDIDLTWEGNRITKAPYELTLDGKKITIRDKKSGEISSIELLTSEPAGLKWEIVPEYTRVSFRHILSPDKLPFEATFRIVGKIPFLSTRAFDDEGELELETSIVGDILTEKLTEVKDKATRVVRPAKGEIKVDPTWQVTASTDDCTRNTVTTNFFSTTYSALYLGYSSPSYPSRGSAARFLNVAIPAGSTIVSAALILTARGSHTATVVKSRIRAELNLTPVTFVDVADFDARTWTTEFINWDDIAAWTNDVEYPSPDFADVIQEVADLGAITHLVILWDDFEQRSDQVNSHYRNSHSYNSDPAKAPKLVITYTVLEEPTDPGVSLLQSLLRVIMAGVILVGVTRIGSRKGGLPLFAAAVVGIIAFVIIDILIQTL